MEELVLPLLLALPVAPVALLAPVPPDELPVRCSRLMVERRRTKGREWPEPLWPRGKRLAMTMMDTDRMQIKEMSEMQTGNENGNGNQKRGSQ